MSVSIEILYLTENDLPDGDPDNVDDGNPLTPGFYWQSCFPGCLPDSDPFGPFTSASEATEDAVGDIVESDVHLARILRDAGEGYVDLTEWPEDGDPNPESVSVFGPVSVGYVGCEVGLLDSYAYWASAYVNGDTSGLTDHDEFVAVETALAADGWRVVHLQEYGATDAARPWETETDDTQLHGATCEPFFGTPDHSPNTGAGDVVTYVCHRDGTPPDGPQTDVEPPALSGPVAGASWVYVGDGDADPFRCIASHTAENWLACYHGRVGGEGLFRSLQIWGCDTWAAVAGGVLVHKPTYEAIAKVRESMMPKPPEYWDAVAKIILAGRVRTYGGRTGFVLACDVDGTTATSTVRWDTGGDTAYPMETVEAWANRAAGRRA